MVKVTAHNALRRNLAPEITILDGFEQGSEEWYLARRGIPTSSEFAPIMAGGVGREKYLNRLAGELMTEELAETYRNAAMDRGNAMEAEGRAFYAGLRFSKLTEVGFVLRRLPSGRFTGCSPDGLCDADGVVEIKTHKPEVLIPIIERGLPPVEHRAQVQGSLWITGRAWCDLVLFYRRMPGLIFRFERDEPYIKQLSDAVEVFDYDLHLKVKNLRGRL